VNKTRVVVEQLNAWAEQNGWEKLEKFKKMSPDNADMDTIIEQMSYWADKYNLSRLEKFDTILGKDTSEYLREKYITLSKKAQGLISDLDCIADYRTTRMMLGRLDSLHNFSSDKSVKSSKYNHVCTQCHNVIQIGDSCVTGFRKIKCSKREWMCLNCLKKRCNALSRLCSDISEEIDACESDLNYLEDDIED
jgi:hypothetical protein